MRRALLLLSALAVLIGALGACGKKKRPSTDSLRMDEVTADDVTEEKRRLAAGESVGSALLTPAIELDYRGVTVNGRLVAAPADIDATKVEPIPKLAAWLEGLRTHWRAIHPADEPTSGFDLDAASDADAIAAESVIATAARSGYRRIRMKIDEIAWEASLTAPVVLGHDEPATRRARIALRRAIVGWEIDVRASGPCDDAPNVRVRVVKSDALGAIVDEICASVDRCLVSIEPSPGGAFTTVATLLAPAFAAGRPSNVTLDLFPNDASATAAPPAPSSRPPLGPPLKTPAKITTGAIQVTGRLAPDVVDNAVNAKLDAVRACYEDELRRGPAFSGRAVLKLAIDASGAVAQACDGGSDAATRDVVACIVQASSTLTFPAPASGAVTIVVPFVLAPR